MLLSQLKKPTILVLSNDTISEGVSGRTVGFYSTTPSHGYTYAITADPSNKFTLVGNALTLDNAIDFAVTPTLSVTVRASKAGRLDVDLTSTIIVTEVVDPPVATLYFDPTRDSGTTGDYFVAPATATPAGDNNNPGTVEAPFLTITKAITAAKSAGNNKVIKVRDGTFRETLNLDLLQGEISGYGTEKPIISALRPLTGWTQCDSDDEQYVGASFANVYKKTVATSSYQHANAICLNVHENGVRMPIVRDRADDTDELRQGDEHTYHVADTFVLDASGYIRGITDTTIFAQYTEAQLLRMLVHTWRSPNATSLFRITAYDSGTKTITLANLEPASDARVQGYAAATPLGNPIPDCYAYSLNNALPNFSVGRWGFRIDGTDTIIYVWPNNAANLTANMEYSTDWVNIDLNRCSNMTISDLKFRGASGLTIKQGAAISAKGNSLVLKENVTIRNIDCYGQYSANQAYGILYLANMDNMNVMNVSIDVGPGNFGIYAAGGTSGDHAHGGYVRFIEVNNGENSPFRFFGLRDFVIAFSKAENCCFAAHANKLNFYEGCDNVMAWGIKFIDCVGGYVTWQRSSRVVVAMCEIPSAFDGRSIVDQQSSTLPSGGMGTNPSDNFFFNLLCPPDSASERSSGGAALSSGSSVTIHNNVLAVCHSNYALYNSAVDGGGIGWSDQLIDESNNVVTRLSFGYFGAGPTARNWLESDYDVTTVVELDLNAVYTDWTTDDFTPAGPSSPLITTAAKDLNASGLIPALQLRFPNFQYFDRDINFVQFSWASPFIGPDSTIGA